MRGSREWKRGRGQLGVVTVAVNVSRVKCEDPLGWLPRSGAVPGDEGLILALQSKARDAP